MSALDNDGLSRTSLALRQCPWPDRPRAGLTGGGEVVSTCSFIPSSTTSLGLDTGWDPAETPGGRLNNLLPTGWVDSGWGQLSRSWVGEKLVIVCLDNHLAIHLCDTAPI